MLLFPGLAIHSPGTPNMESKGQLIASAMWKEVIFMVVNCCYCCPGHIYHLVMGASQWQYVVPAMD